MGTDSTGHAGARLETVAMNESVRSDGSIRRSVSFTVEPEGMARSITSVDRLLEAMATNPGKLMTHRLLLQKVWGPGYGTESNYIRLYVRQFRQKLTDDPARPKWITTEPGLGYRWLPEPKKD
jgi:DNA-binding response OmpR family regulator